MKQKKLTKKLLLKKETITDLTKEEMLALHAGGTVWGRTCEGDSDGLGACS